MNNFIPAKETIEELQAKAAEYERQAKEEQEPAATSMRNEAALLREWINALESGHWAS
jgi:hypothetical protein